MALASRTLMLRGNRVRFEHADRLDAAQRRPSGRGLLTFSNHTSLFDDPLLIACLAPARWHEMRWIAADALNFFGSPLRAFVFNGGKCVPLARGTGIDQPGMAFLARKLADGDWVHVFPEGGRSRDPDGRLRLPFKAGMAHLVKASSPLLLPFHHHGMADVLPIGAVLPRLGKQVTVRFGTAHDSATGLAGQSVQAITRWAEAQLQSLESAG